MKSTYHAIAISLFVLVVGSTGTLAQTTSALVDFEHLGEPLILKKLGQKEIAILKKLNIEEDSGGATMSNPSRVIGIAGGKGLFVLATSCESAGDGSSEWCSLNTIASLETGKQFRLITDEPFLLSKIEGNDGSETAIRYMKNEKGELSAFIIARNIVKKFKGKMTCENKGAIVDVDGKAQKLSLRFTNKSLGPECFVPPKQAQNDPKYQEKYDAALNVFQKNLFMKVLAN